MLRFNLSHAPRVSVALELLVAATIFTLFRPHILALKPVPPVIPQQGPYSSNVLLVKFKKADRPKIKEGDVRNTGDTDVDQILQKHNAIGFTRVAKAGKKSNTNAEIFGWYKITLDPNRPIASKDVNGQIVYPDLDQMQSQLQKDPNVESVTKDYEIHSAVVPNDPYYSSSGSWGQAYDDLWGLKKINASTAWDTTTGSSSVTAAVIDSGVDNTHPDIAANIWTNPGETGMTQPGDRCWTGTPQDKSTNNCDDDGDGFIDDVHGWNFVSNNNNTMDDNGHGTHVAGTIAAVGNNSTGVVGVSWNTKIMPVKVLDSTGSGTMSNAALGLQYAADMGAKVTNNSWSCGCNSSLVEDAVNYEHQRNVTTVVAAGNNAGDSLDYSPSDVDGTIVVGATDSNDAIASFSNTGPKVDVTAPGVDILSLKSSEASTVCTGSEIVGTNYCHISGTSMATPHVTGLVSLMLSVNSSLTPEQIRQILRTNSQDLGTAGHDNTFGYGRIKADTAVAAAASPAVLTPYISSPSSRSTLSGTVTFTGDANGTNFSSYELDVGAGRNPSSWTTISTGSTPITGGTLATLDTTTLADGSYTFRLTAMNASAQTFEFKIFDVAIDNFTESIASPINIVSFNSSIPIIGTALTNNGLGFSYYVVDYGLGTSPSSWSTAGITLTGGGNSQVDDSTLASWDTTGLTNAQTYTLRLTVYATNGSSSSFTSTIVPDSSLVSGWPKYIPGNNCSTFCNGAGEVFADLDGDGQKEVIIPAATNKIYAFHKDGTPVAGWPVTVTPGDYFADQPVVADLDGDLKPEIIISARIGTTNSRRIYIIKSDGTLYPGWPEPVVNVGGVGDDPTPSVADLNKDGNKELVMITYDSLSGGSTLPRLHAFKLDGTDLSGFPKVVSFVPWIYMPPTIADLDGDGYPEIIYPDYNQIYVFNHDGTLRSGWPVTLPNFNSSIETIQGPAAVGDVNGDGKQEIIVDASPNGVIGTGSFPTYAYNDSGTLLSGWPYAGETYLEFGGTDRNSPLTADIDGDGKDEVFSGSFGPRIIDDGTGVRSLPFFAGQEPPSIADFNGDGNYKFPGMYSHGIHWGNMDFSIYWSNDNLNNLSAELPEFATIPVADLDHDNKLEFAASVIHNDEIDAYLWEMPGNSKPLDNWPMSGHDPAHTGHFTVGQETVDNIPPQVVITSPSNNSTSSGTVSITANAIDDTAISKVEFYANGSLISTDTTFPYSAAWDTSGATPGNYSLTAKAYDSSNNTTTSQAVSTTVPDTTPPSDPSNLSMTGNTDSSISFNWTAATDNVGVAGYRIYRNGGLVASQAGTNFTDSLLTPSTSYTYGVEAYDAAGNTSGRPTANFSTAADSTPPSVPSGLAASNVTDVSQKISWTASTDNVGVTGYEVYRDSNLVGTSATSSYTDSGLQPLTSYSYTVKAYDARGNHSGFSTALASQTQADTNPPAAPTNLQATLITMYSQHISWSAASDDVGVTGYRLYKNGVLLLTTSLLGADVDGLNAGTSYDYVVQAYDEAGNISADSATLAASTSPQKLGDVNGDGSVDIFDLSLLLSHYNQNYGPADFDKNGVVNIFDLSTLLSHYGK